MAAILGADGCFRNDFRAVFSLVSGFELDFDLASVSVWIAPDWCDLDRCDFGPIFRE